MLMKFLNIWKENLHDDLKHLNRLLMMLSSGDIQELMIDNARGHSDDPYIWKPK